MKKSLSKSVAAKAFLMMSFWAPPQWWYTYPTPVYPTPVYFTPAYPTPVQPTLMPTPTPIIACPQIFQPVCGINGVTYGNRCEAEVLNHVPVAHDGPCGSVKPLPPPPPQCHWWWPCPTWPPSGPVPTFGPIPTVPPITFPWPTFTPWPAPMPTPQNQNPFGTFCSPYIPVCIPTIQAG